MLWEIAKWILAWLTVVAVAWLFSRFLDWPEKPLIRRWPKWLLESGEVDDFESQLRRKK